MDSKEKKQFFLSNLFQHLDGIVLIPTILELQKNKILEEIYIKKECSLSYLSAKHNANAGYLNVALRLLCSQGLLIQKKIQNDTIFINNKLEKWLEKDIISKYQIVAPLYLEDIQYQQIIKKTTTENSTLFTIIQNYINQNFSKDINPSKDEQVSFNWETHLEGAIIGPIIVTLATSNCFKDLELNQELNLNINQTWQTIITKLFIKSNILDNNKLLSEYGYFLLKRATSYGVTVSYLPTFRNIEKLLYANWEDIWKNQKDEEVHVDRSMNVWGSGGAHHTYFKKVDKIIIDLFNLPLEKQPKGFIDIGCGNGKLIEHIFDLIYYKTLRGKHLESHPLFIVGSDFNYKALEATNQTISKADIWAKTAFGDISDPDDLSKRLMQEHKINLSDLLNVRSFLDHNRIYTTPIHKRKLDSTSTGAFCYQGKKLNNHDVEQNLIEHFQKWAPYLKKYGLLIVELHTIDPLIASENIGKNAITAYDASHGFSDQYIVEYDIFLKAALKADLKPDPEHEYTFPNKEVPIVSINRLV